MARPPALVRDLRGTSRLAVDGVKGVTRIVESMHARIAGGKPQPGTSAHVPARGITGFVYRTVEGTTQLVGQAIDGVLAAVELASRTSSSHGTGGGAASARGALVSALNGVLGDHLEHTRNPLALTMELRRHDAAQVSGDIVVLVHGLCMNDTQWLRDGHDHGRLLQASFGWTPVYARYNSGRHIAANGADLAAALEKLVAGWPVPVKSLQLVGHSMGGLVARAAVEQAGAMRWPRRLRTMVFIGTPHRGAPLERMGNWVQALVRAAPYAAPLAQIAGVRSAGITDLRHGDAAPLPAHVACYAIAGTLGGRWPGDGLVPVASALAVEIPAGRQFVAQGVGHLDLLGSKVVGDQMLRWLAPGARAAVRRPSTAPRPPASPRR
jgi:pimeloyl-ACP methyl ester carboxylesterase